ncbi:hypothetical protein IQE94_00470 [Synechocystis sp. PCC 7339]|nr:hypothetical protein [Synechocystis sp. LEGE 06083]MBE9204282.1 hypothetical protein [Synechocystis salina LEGE 06099]QUS60697.1 hypothetical protein HTZ78_08435 [Synechocystis sp. PCC 7338]UAJ72881.1 hypothetical protein IQE94_00470 [Synechocystis sp. PCC 7339]
MAMDKDTKFALLVMGVPLLGVLYCAFILAVMLSSETARQHPIITGTIFVLAPSLISGTIWLRASFKARKQENLGL